MILPLLLPQNDHPQGIHYPGNINPFRAPRCALKAGGTEPKGIDSKHLLFQTEKCIPNGLVWADLHCKGNRTPRRTISALIAGKEVLSADQFHLLRKFVVNLLPRQLYLHLPSPYPHPLPPVEREINRPPVNPLPLDGGGGGWG